MHRPSLPPFHPPPSLPFPHSASGSNVLASMFVVIVVCRVHNVYCCYCLVYPVLFNSGSGSVLVSICVVIVVLRVHNVFLSLVNNFFQSPLLKTPYMLSVHRILGAAGSSSSITGRGRRGGHSPQIRKGPSPIRGA